MPQRRIPIQELTVNGELLPTSWAMLLAHQDESLDGFDESVDFG